MHRRRRAAHVHQADAAARVRGDDVERARAAQRRDVVDDVGAEIERGAHHLGLGRVDRHRAAEADRGTRAPARHARARPRPRPAPRPAGSTRRRCRGCRRPRFSSRSQRAIARSGVSAASPSENESGVTLTIPITRGRARSISNRPACQTGALIEKRGRSPVWIAAAALRLTQRQARCPASPAARRSAAPTAATSPSACAGACRP